MLNGPVADSRRDADASTRDSREAAKDARMSARASKASAAIALAALLFTASPAVWSYAPHPVAAIHKIVYLDSQIAAMDAMTVKPPFDVEKVMDTRFLPDDLKEPVR